MKIEIDLPPEVMEILKRLDERLELVAKQLTEMRSTPSKVYMRPKEFAERRALSLAKVHELLEQGMPCEGRGRMRRIPVAKADDWLRREFPIPPAIIRFQPL
jgi:hypothetical protein